MAEYNQEVLKADLSNGRNPNIIVDTLTEAVRSITDSATKQQSNFESIKDEFQLVNSSNNEVITALNNLAGIMSSFSEGGRIRKDGQTGGAIAFSVTSDEAARILISESVSDAVEDIEEIIKDESQKNMDKLEEESQKTRDQAEDLANKASEERKKQLEEITAALKTQQENMDSISTFLNKISGNGNAKSKITSIADLLKNFLDDEEGKAVVSSILTVASGVGMATAAVDAIGKAIDWNYSANQASINQTGESGNYGISVGMDIQKQMESYFTGIDSSVIGNVQNTLVNNGADYGSYEYNTGLGFATMASTEYGMSAQKAAELYMKTVVRGNMEMNDLNEAMASLKDIVEDTGISMSEAVKDFENSVSNWTSLSGSDTSGSEYAIDIESYVEPLSGHGTNAAVSSFVSSYSNDREFMQLSSEYEDNYTEAVSASLAAWDIFTSGRPSSNSEYAMALVSLPLSDEGLTLIDYVNSGAWDKLETALKNLNSSWDYYGGIKGVRKGVLAQFPNATNIDDASSIADFFKDMSETMSNMRDEEKNNVIGEDASDITSNDITSSLSSDSATTSWYNSSLFGSSEFDIDSATNENIFGNRDVTSSNINQNAWNDILNMAVSQGYLSESDVANMNNSQAQEYAKTFLESYENSDMYKQNNSFIGRLYNTTPFLRGLGLTGATFSDYMYSDEGREIASQLSSKYGDGSYDASSYDYNTFKDLIKEAINESNGVGGQITVGVKDDVSDVIYTLWKASDDALARAEGRSS